MLASNLPWLHADLIGRPLLENTVENSIGGHPSSWDAHHCYCYIYCDILTELKATLIRGLYHIHHSSCSLSSRILFVTLTFNQLGPFSIIVTLPVKFVHKACNEIITHIKLTESSLDGNICLWFFRSVFTVSKGYLGRPRPLRHLSPIDTMSRPVG